MALARKKHDHAKRFQRELVRLFSRNDWGSARQLLRRELKDSPNSHWLVTRIGTTYYEEKRYKLALSTRCVRFRCNQIALWRSGIAPVPCTCSASFEKQSPFGIACWKRASHRLRMVSVAKDGRVPHRC
jgi:hypothetical protein